MYSLFKVVHPLFKAAHSASKLIHDLFKPAESTYDSRGRDQGIGRWVVEGASGMSGVGSNLERAAELTRTRYHSRHLVLEGWSMHEEKERRLYLVERIPASYNPASSNQFPL